MKSTIWQKSCRCGKREVKTPEAPSTNCSCLRTVLLSAHAKTLPHGNHEH